MSDWAGLAARARGLRGHVLSGAHIAALGARGVQAFADALAAAGIVPAGTPATPTALDVAATRSAADRIATLARWGDIAGTPIESVVAHLEHVAVRALVRGAAAGTPAAVRLATAVPTPALPRRILERAARLDTPAAVAASLLTIGHPFGAPLARALANGGSLLAAEHALAVAWGALAARQARRDDAPLREWARDTATLSMLWTAMAIADGEPIGDEALEPVPGAWPMPVDPLRMARAGRDALRGALSSTMEEHPAVRAALLAPIGGEEAAADAAHLARYDDWARREPTSSAPVVHVLLALSAERAAVSRALWRASLSPERATAHRVTDRAANHVTERAAPRATSASS